MIALVFPGQGSQKPGMGKDLVDVYPAARNVFDRLSESTGRNLAELCWDTDEETLRQTDNAQLALYITSIAAFEALRSQVTAAIEAVAGHSVGEYAALAVAGVYSYEVGARLVQERGRIMAESAKIEPGAMAAVLGMESPELAEICRAQAGVVVIANDNSPGQLVISGDQAAVALASAEAAQAGAKRVIPLNVSGAFHSPLMANSARQMRMILDQYPASDPKMKIYANVTSEPEMMGSSWPDLLERQLKSQVRWTESVQHMARDGMTVAIECGSGEVLSGLMKRIDKSVTSLRVNESVSLANTCEFVNARS